jgi:hypothetical protein
MLYEIDSAKSARVRKSLRDAGGERDVGDRRLVRVDPRTVVALMTMGGER